MHFHFTIILLDPDPEVGCDVFARLPPDIEEFKSRVKDGVQDGADDRFQSAFDLDDIPFMLSKNPLPTIIQVIGYTVRHRSYVNWYNGSPNITVNILKSQNLSCI